MPVSLAHSCSRGHSGVLLGGHGSLLLVQGPARDIGVRGGTGRAPPHAARLSRRSLPAFAPRANRALSPWSPCPHLVTGLSGAVAAAFGGGRSRSRSPSGRRTPRGEIYSFDVENANAPDLSAAEEGEWMRARETRVSSSTCVALDGLLAFDGSVLLAPQSRLTASWSPHPSVFWQALR